MEAEENDARTHIVAFGGGEGLHALLTGLAARDARVTAVLTVADDGGSSGRLRKEFDIPPPGDIRRCLVALSSADPVIGELFEYRFTDSYLKGHSFGNLFIAVLTRLSGDFRQAIERAHNLLGARGQVIPATNNKVVLVAEHEDGSKSTGQQAIANAGKPIRDLRLVPRPPAVSDEIRKAIASADLICLGPGSLYTRIAPNLLVPDMVRCINEAEAPVVYVANLMTQPGETDGFSLRDHLEVFARLDPPLMIDTVLVADDEIDPRRRHEYSATGAEVVRNDLRPEEARLRRAPFVALGDKVRHDPDRLAASLLGLVRGDEREREAVD